MLRQSLKKSTTPVLRQITLPIFNNTALTQQQLSASFYSKPAFGIFSTNIKISGVASF